LAPHENPDLPAHYEVICNMQATVAENLHFLAPIDRAWQPTDYLPDLSADGWREQLDVFRQSARQISDEMLVVVVGDMVTEEALPSYSMSLNTLVRDETCQSPEPWARWLRGWTAEENRHGDLLNAYLRLTGRVDMHAVELTVHYLLANGFNPNPKAALDPYNGLIYTSFQERATRISHGNAAKIVSSQGDAFLGKICQRIAGDESRHETFYTRMMEHVINVDPDGGILAFRTMLRGLIAMPGRLMFDGKDPDLFDHFAAVAQRSGVYTVYDYAAIIEHLVDTWNIAGRSVTGPAAKAQDYICRQAERYLRLADEVTADIEKKPLYSFAWIHDRKA